MGSVVNQIHYQGLWGKKYAHECGLSSIHAGWELMGNAHELTLSYGVTTGTELTRWSEWSKTKSTTASLCVTPSWSPGEGGGFGIEATACVEHTASWSEAAGQIIAEAFEKEEAEEYVFYNPEGKFLWQWMGATTDLCNVKVTTSTKIVGSTDGPALRPCCAPGKFRDPATAYENMQSPCNARRDCLCDPTTCDSLHKNLDDIIPEVPKVAHPECHEYCVQEGACNWAAEYLCPWQPRGIRPDASAHTNFEGGLTAFTCCCVHRTGMNEPCGGELYGEQVQYREAVNEPCGGGLEL